MVIPPVAHTPVPNQPPLCGGWALTGSQARCNLQQQTLSIYRLHPAFNRPGRGRGPSGGRLGPWPHQATTAWGPRPPCPPGPGEDPGRAGREARLKAMNQGRVAGGLLVASSTRCCRLLQVGHFKNKVKLYFGTYGVFNFFFYLRTSLF